MAREVPRSDYWPSCKVRLIIRFEEYGQKPSTNQPAKRPTIRKGGEETPPPKTKPTDSIQSADDLTHVVVGIIPKTAQIGRNGIREAASLSFELKYADLPLDPRTVRSCAVECYMGTVTPEDFAKGIAGATRTVTESGGTYAEPLHLVPDEFQGPRGKRSNLRFQGWVDDIELTLDEGEPLLRFECTDNTRILIGQEAPPQLTVNPSKPLDQAVNDYLANFPQFAGIKAKYLPENATAPALGEAFGPTKDKTTKKGAGPAPSNQPSVWDYLTDCVRMTGHSIRMSGTDVIIQRVRALLKEGYDHRSDDPFKGGRRLPSGVVIPRRRYIYGENIKPLSVKRNFTRLAPTNIELRCYDPTRKQVLVARHPLKAGQQIRPSPGEQGDQVWKVYPVHGVADEKTLERIAQEVYEQLNRGELEMRFTTKNLASYGGGNDDPDSLDVMPGDSVDVGVRRDPSLDPQGVTATKLEDTLAVQEAATEYLLALGHDEKFARAYAKAFANVGLVTTYHVKKLGIEWDESESYTISFECVNYVVVRADQDASPGVEPPKEDAAPADPVDVTVEDN